jgi:hypothetical protein
MTGSGTMPVISINYFLSQNGLLNRKTKRAGAG